MRGEVTLVCSCSVMNLSRHAERHLARCSQRRSRGFHRAGSEHLTVSVPLLATLRISPEEADEGLRPLDPTGSAFGTQRGRQRAPPPARDTRRNFSTEASQLWVADIPQERTRRDGCTSPWCSMTWNRRIVG